MKQARSTPGLGYKEGLCAMNASVRVLASVSAQHKGGGVGGQGALGGRGVSQHPQETWLAGRLEGRGLSSSPPPPLPCCVHVVGCR